MSSPASEPFSRTVSRRAVSQGLAWSAPAVALTAAAPAFAASAPPQGCATLDWTTVDSHTAATATGGGRITDALTFGTTSLTLTISQTRTSGLAQGPGTANNGLGGTAVPTTTDGDFSIQAPKKYDGTQETWSLNARMYGGQNYEHFATSTVNSGFQNPLSVPTSGTYAYDKYLVLDQGSDGTRVSDQTLTFTFTDASGKVYTPTSVSMVVYDLTAANTSGQQTYTDTVAVNGAATKVTATSAAETATFTSASGGTVISQQNTTTVSDATADVLAFDVTNIQGSAFTFRYYNTTPIPLKTAYMSSQYIALGDMKFCF